jgi:TBCC domain-containing protein 1
MGIQFCLLLATIIYRFTLIVLCCQVVKVEHCERVHIIAAAKRICIANCRECIFYLGVNHQPLVLGDNHKLQVRAVAPFPCAFKWQW